MARLLNQALLLAQFYTQKRTVTRPFFITTRLLPVLFLVI